MGSFKTSSQIQIGKNTAKNSEIATSAINNYYISGTGSSGYAVTTTVTSVVVTDSGFANTGGLIGNSNSFVKIFGAGFVANTVVVVNANTVPQANVTYTSSSELRVALPILANVVTVTFNVLNPSDNTVTNSQPSYPISYLVVGGGGAGGGFLAGGGGGAGGLFTGNTFLTTGLSYQIVVGNGGQRNGTGVPGCCQRFGFNGNTSSFLTFVALGGGGGGSSLSAALGIGRTGASGGGGSGGSSSPQADAGSGTPGQGNPGGQGRTCGPVNYAGGGGGGYSTSGARATPTAGAAGGTGYTYPFTGLGYAGGGGGGQFNPGCGTPGPCRGGAGGTASVAGQAATNGSGSGGGGGGSSSSTPSRQIAGPGGPGAVIIVVPNAAYPTVISTGATVSTPACAPGRTVLIWNGPAVTSTANTTYTFIA